MFWKKNEPAIWQQPWIEKTVYKVNVEFDIEVDRGPHDMASKIISMLKEMDKSIVVTEVKLKVDKTYLTFPKNKVPNEIP